MISVGLLGVVRLNRAIKVEVTGRAELHNNRHSYLRTVVPEMLRPLEQRLVEAPYDAQILRRP